MHQPQLWDDEDLRIAAIERYDLVGGSPDPGFDRLVAMAARLFGTAMAQLSLVGRDRQFSTARFGHSVCESRRDLSFCTHVVGRDDVLVVLDAARDPRFAHNPAVAVPGGIRFYAGAPLVSPDGFALGTICVYDPAPREGFSDEQRRLLADVAALAIDRMEQRRVAQAEQLSRTRFENIASTSSDGIICTDAEGRLTFWNAGAERLLGHAAADALGSPMELIVSDETMPGYRSRLRAAAESAARGGGGGRIEVVVRHRDGSDVWVELALSAWSEGGKTAFGAILRDLTERRGHEARLHRLAHRDPLTDLANRTVLRERIDVAAAAGAPATVLVVDLDGFKEVNDSIGHAAGDAVLRTVAERLRRCIRPGDTVGRLGGDEFACLLAGTGDAAAAEATARTVVASLALPIDVEGQAVQIGASVGVALAPAHGTAAADLLSCADLALYQAKAEGRGCCRMFVPALRLAAQRRRGAEAEIRGAVARDEFEVHYQPQFRLSDGALAGAEALLRWRHPDHGLLPPTHFIAQLETIPQSAAVGHRVLALACAQAGLWRRAGASGFRVGVNLFASQLAGDGLRPAVDQALREAGLPASALELEITETIVLGRDPALLGALRDLRRDGVGVAFDDYGTGYAALAMLKTYPLTRLKIDRSFVGGLCDRPGDAAIVEAVLSLGRSFGLQVIAEGVETEEQAATLRGLGCAEVQGYLYGPPMPADEFERRFVGSRPRMLVAAE